MNINNEFEESVVVRYYFSIPVLILKDTVKIVHQDSHLEINIFRGVADTVQLFHSHLVNPTSGRWVTPLPKQYTQSTGVLKMNEAKPNLNDCKI
jgi:hypothetical protein